MKKHDLKLLVLSIFMVASCAVHAQDTIFKGEKSPENQVVLYSDTTLVRNVGWVRAPFWDNWYVQLEPLGGLLYHGVEDNQANLFDRLTWQGQFNIGRWVFPMIGYRFGGGYGYGRGFLSKETYNQYGGAIGYGQCGIVNGRALGGYYHEYDDELLIQKWKYAFANADLMVNFSYLKSYNPKRPFMTMAYAGVGVYFGLNEGFHDYEGTAGHVDKENDPNRGMELHVGIIEQYQFSERWRIYADFRVSAMQRTFDREYVPALETAMEVADVMTSLHVGVQYNFNWRKEEKRRQWYKETIDKDFDGENTPHYALATQNVRYTNYIDTLFVYDTINTDLAEIIKKNAQDSLDALRRRFERDCNDMTLDDIFSKHLLPYEMVFFELDKWDILSSENLKIAKMAALMKNFPDTKFMLIGSADSKTGTVKRNDYLSHQRADVVYNKLVMDYDINPKQLERVYLGGILDYEPYQLNRATVIIMKHEKVLEEFNKLKSKGKAGGSSVSW